MKTDKLILLIAVVASALLQSCNTLHFSMPQPYDKENLAIVPKELQGQWNLGNDSIVIDELGMRVIEYNEVEMEDFICISSGVFLCDGKFYSYDDIVRFKMHGSFPLRRSEQKITLSDSVFLRGGEQRYIANFKTEDAWEILLITKRKNGEITMHYPSLKKFKRIFKEGYIETIDHMSESRTIMSYQDVSMDQSKRLKSKKGLLYLLKADGSFETALP